MSQKEKVGHCSWCFKLTGQALVQKNTLQRNVHQCNSCLKRTLKCVHPSGCSDFCRGLPGFDERFCYLHKGQIKSWDVDPAMFSHKSWCSWCFELTGHQLIQDNIVQKVFHTKKVYQCESCGRSTRNCSSCTEAMTRDQSSSKCAKCEGTIQSWENSAQNKASHQKKGWCSWCFENSTHSLEEKNTVGRDDYVCGFCTKKTTPCSNCSEGMCAGLSRSCVKCTYEKKKLKNKEVDSKLASSKCENFWEALQRKKEEAYEKEFTFAQFHAELQRTSDFRKKASEIGMLRPFLLLVSMHSSTRSNVAALLGWCILLSESFGDTHAESWEIISKKMKGLQARSSHVTATRSNWYALLYRVNKAAFQLTPDFKDKFAQSNVSIAECSEKQGIPLMNQIENEVIKRLAHFQSLQPGNLESNPEMSNKINQLLSNSALAQFMLTRTMHFAGFTQDDNSLSSTETTKRFFLSALASSGFFDEEGEDVSSAENAELAPTMEQLKKECQEFQQISASKTKMESQSDWKQKDELVAARLFRLMQLMLLSGDGFYRRALRTQKVMKTAATIGTKIILANFLGPVVGFAMTATLITSKVLAALGPSYEVLLPPVGHILFHKLLLAANGVSIDTYY